MARRKGWAMEGLAFPYHQHGRAGRPWARMAWHGRSPDPRRLSEKKLGFGALGDDEIYRSATHERASEQSTAQHSRAEQLASGAPFPAGKRLGFGGRRASEALVSTSYAALPPKGALTSRLLRPSLDLSFFSLPPRPCMDRLGFFFSHARLGYVGGDVLSRKLGTHTTGTSHALPAEPSPPPHKNLQAYSTVSAFPAVKKVWSGRGVGTWGGWRGFRDGRL
ncbi:hypothetical protein BS50DRAFT_74907 [Corynespora cassiicola Philippines]|uniref:Uncharacterized protein n=1 Tax=Corynespora cassiicola Philippines TaxID=1448308 RepID=A0A2T2NGT6_CORCC|nr:hypothetical protein BS50DRAFT_74907 [Corynespora cassiicola Philippines]